MGGVFSGGLILFYFYFIFFFLLGGGGGWGLIIGILRYFCKGHRNKKEVPDPIVKDLICFLSRRRKTVAVKTAMKRLGNRSDKIKKKLLIAGYFTGVFRVLQIMTLRLKLVTLYKIGDKIQGRSYLYVRKRRGTGR